MLITAWGGGAASFAQAPPQQAETHKKFSIGYLPEGSDVPSATACMEELRQFLVRRDETRQGLARAGYGEVVLSPCDGPRDMVQRMNAGEFDLVFATAIVYAQLVGPTYEPVLQFKRPGGDFQMPGREGVFRQGIIFVGPGSALFKAPGEPTREELRKLLERVPLAVPTADSAAGYLAPRYKMEHDLGLRQGPAPLFCGSDSEVVKHVVSGLAEVGACRVGALAELLPPGGDVKFYKKLALTDPMPTDPILMRRELMPASNGLGVTLKMALRGFFSRPDLTVDNTSPRSFEMIIRYLAELKAPRPATTELATPPAKPAATPAATELRTPMPTATVTPTPTATPVVTPALTPAATPAVTPAATPAMPPAVTPAATPMATPSATPTPTATPAAMAAPASRPALPLPAAAPTPQASPTPSVAAPAPHATPALPPRPDPAPAQGATSATLAAAPATSATTAMPTPTPTPKYKRKRRYPKPTPTPDPNMPELSPALPGLMPAPKPEAPSAAGEQARPPKPAGVRPALPPTMPQAARPAAKPTPAPSPTPQEKKGFRSWWRKTIVGEESRTTSMKMDDEGQDALMKMKQQATNNEQQTTSCNSFRIPHSAFRIRGGLA